MSMSSEFKTKKVFDARFAILVGLNICVLALLAAVFWQLHTNSSGAKWHEEKGRLLRDVGSKLQAAGIIEQATQNFEEYLRQSDVEEDQQANIAFTLGELYSKEGQWEKALKWFYMVESLKAPGDLKTEAGKQVVAILDKLKKYTASKEALKQVTSLNPTPGPKDQQGGVVLAEVNGEKIYLHEFNAVIDQLPPGLQEQLKVAAAKQEFLKKYVADIMLYQKALRQNLGEDPEVRKQMKDVEKQLLIQKVLSEEIHKKIKMDDVDLQNYFTANRDQYKQPAQAQVALIKVKEKTTMQKVEEQLKKGKKFSELVATYSEDEETKKNQGKVSTPVVQGNALLDLPAGEVQKIFVVGAKKATPAILHQGYYYIFFVEGIAPEKQFTFEQVKKQLERDYQMEKGQRLYQQLIQEMISSDEVKLYIEKLQS